MAVKAIPDGYHSVQPYISIAGAEQAMEFYQKAFGAKQRFCMKDKKGLVSHAEIEIGDSCIMMSDEHPESNALSPKHYGGSPVSLMLYVEDCDATYKSALAAGATSVREPKDQFYGDRMAGVKDPFGYTWFIGTHIRDVSPEELEQAAASQNA